MPQNNAAYATIFVIKKICFFFLRETLHISTHDGSAGADS